MQTFTAGSQPLQSKDEAEFVEVRNISYDEDMLSVLTSIRIEPCRLRLDDTLIKG